MKYNIVPILHNIRSLHNVGSILRTCDGLGINEVWVSGYTPYPEIENDERLPHVSKRATLQIAKTALGAQETVTVLHFSEIKELIQHAKNSKILLVAVEQTNDSTLLENFTFKEDIGLVFGNEAEGLDHAMLNACVNSVEIPMKGSKESFNVSVCVGMVLYTVKN